MVDRKVWVAAVALAAFGGSLVSGFHFDDYGMLQDPAVSTRGGWASCWGLYETRPLTWFSFWLNDRISGRSPMLWHAVNLALHVGCALLLYRILSRLIPGAALFAALLFAAHPIAAESVDYVYARAILLATLFCLLAIDAWLRERHWIAVAWFALAVLSKEECVALPLVLVLGGIRRRAMPLVAMFAIALAAGLRLMASIRITGVQGIGPTAGISPLGYLSEQGIAILRYFGLLIFPWSFTVDPQIPMPGAIWRVLAWLVIAALAGAAALRARQSKAAFAVLAGFILLIPSSSIFPAADLAADRRMYLPMLAFAPAIALLLPKRPTRLAAVLTMMLAALSIERTYVWASDERLWSEAVRLAPDKVRPRIQLSRAVAPEDALGILADGEAIAPQNPDLPTEMARVDLELNRPAQALAQAGRALALTPGEPHALNNRGVALMALKQTEAARRDFLAALRTDPCLSEALDNLQHSGGIPADAPHCK